MFAKAHSASLATTTQLCLHVIRRHHALVSLTTTTQSCLQLTLLYSHFRNKLMLLSYLCFQMTFTFRHCRQVITSVIWIISFGKLLNSSLVQPAEFPTENYSFVIVFHYIVLHFNVPHGDMSTLVHIASPVRVQHILGYCHGYACDYAWYTSLFQMKSMRRCPHRDKPVWREKAPIHIQQLHSWFLQKGV